MELHQSALFGPWPAPATIVAVDREGLAAVGLTVPCRECSADAEIWFYGDYALCERCAERDAPADVKECLTPRPEFGDD